MLLSEARLGETKFFSSIFGVVALLGLFLVNPESVLAKTYTIAYFEAGDYPLHRALQLEVRNRLAAIDPEFNIEINYSPDGYKSAEWKRETCKRMAREIAIDPTIDLVIAMGPWTVEDLLSAGFKKPIVAMGRFDPLLEGLAGSDGKPKQKNLTVRARPSKVENDLSVLKAVYPEAKRIGILFFQSNNEFSLVESFFKQKAKRLGLTIVSVAPDPDEAKFLFFKKVAELERKIDALYMTPLYGMELVQINGFFKRLASAKIPVFGSEGYHQLERGAFATNASYTAASAARFHVDKIIKILKGATPSSLPTVFREGRRLALNLDACDRLGIVPAPNLLAEARLIERTDDPSVPLYTIKSTIAEAKFVNPQVLAQTDLLSAARSKESAENRNFYPRLSANAYFNNYDTEPSENALRIRSEGKSGYEIMLNQTLFDWAALRSSSVAKAALAITETNVMERSRRFEFVVATEYIALQKALERYAVISAGREDLQKALQIAFGSYLLGREERNELLRWEIRKDNITSSAVQAREEIESHKIAFLSLLGRAWSEPFTIDRSLYPIGSYDWRYQRPDYLRDQVKRDKVESFWLELAMQNSTDITIARSELAGARAEQSAQIGDFLPRIEGYVGYFNDEQYAVRAPLTDYEAGWTFGARVHAPLFDGGRAIKRRAQLKAELSSREYLVDQALLESSARVRQAFSAFLAAFDRTQFATRRAHLSTETLEHAFSVYERGEIGLTEMADELDQTVEARLGLIDAIYNFHNARHALYYSAGLNYITPRSAEEVALFESIDEYLSQ
ncbi:TolC family protein [Gemmatimonas aurantiaca]|nr:TolC family protein [Gemmatimonas aurantiaca]